MVFMMSSMRDCGGQPCVTESGEARTMGGQEKCSVRSMFSCCCELAMFACCCVAVRLRPWARCLRRAPVVYARPAVTGPPGASTNGTGSPTSAAPRPLPDPVRWELDSTVKHDVPQPRLRHSIRETFCSAWLGERSTARMRQVVSW